MEAVPNVLAERYASRAMKALWLPAGRVVIERDFWLAVLKAQSDLGLDIPPEAAAAYERVKDRVDLDSIQKRERALKHDVKARIEEFCALAGREHIHKGMTSRDLTENVEQLQIHRSLGIILEKSAAAVCALAERAREAKDIVITARTHNVPAQPSTLGKRLAMFGEEMLRAIRRLRELADNYPARGLKGAAGTQLDQLTLFGGDIRKVEALEEKILGHLGIKNHSRTVGQVYPRSLDFEVVSALFQAGAGPSSFALTLRLMAGHELAGEGFGEKQVGSSAMPHKMNSRSCERINGLHKILQGHVTMAAALAGNQWNEGDVSCSVTRRVVLPDSFFALDGLLETFITVVRQMEWFPAVIERENRHYLPFLAATTVLMEAVKAGAGRETAHEAIREHAVAAALDSRRGETGKNNLIERLAQDTRLGLSKDKLENIINNAARLAGAAPAQVEAFCQEAEALKKRFPGAAEYQPEDIL